MAEILADDTAFQFAVLFTSNERVGLGQPSFYGRRAGESWLLQSVSQRIA
jgi:hypothetical protein